MFAPDTANKLVNLTLAQNKSIVDAVASGMIKTGTRLNAIFNSATGREAYMPKPWQPGSAIFFRDTFGAAVVIVHNSKSFKGFSVITAFPF